MDNSKEILSFLKERFKIERRKKDRSGIYAYTQRLLAYNSNKIEGSTLTEEQTASLFDNGTLPKSDNYYRAKDVEEMNGHFLMFNKMLDTLEEPLSQELIKSFHFELKSGVFEDRANGYAIGDYKTRPNIIGMNNTTRPENVQMEMSTLLEWYSKQSVDLSVLAEFHARHEAIHPFQDGNGRTGRMILFRECVKNSIVPVIIRDENRDEYIDGLRQYQKDKSIDKLVCLLKVEQEFYAEQCHCFI